MMGVKKSPYRNEYLFPKEQQFFIIIRKLLEELNFDWEDFETFGFETDEDDDVTKNEVDIKSIKDEINNFTNKDYSIDIIFLSKKIHVIINSHSDKQNEIANILNKYLEED